MLQTVPKGVALDKIKEELKNVCLKIFKGSDFVHFSLKLNGVVEIQKLHVWKLSDNKIVASAHITFIDVKEYLLIVNAVKKIFHEKGIDATTIEPNFLNVCILDKLIKILFL